MTNEELKWHRMNVCAEFMRARIINLSNFVAGYVNSHCETGCCIHVWTALKDFDYGKDRDGDDYKLIRAETAMRDTFSNLRFNFDTSHLRGRSIEGRIDLSDENRVWIKKPDVIGGNVDESGT